MGILDTIKGLFKGREHQIKGGIDKVSHTLERKVPAQAGRIDDLSDKAKGAVDKLGADPAATAPATASPPNPTPVPPTPPSSTTPTTPSARPTTPPSPSTPPESTPPTT